MGFVPALNVAQVNIRWLCAGENVENTLYFQRAQAWTSDGLEGLGGALSSWLFDNLMGIVSVGAQVREIYLRDLTTANSLVYSYTTGLPLQGSASGELLPNNSTLCVSFRTNKAGRSMRGRNYSVGMTELHQSASIVTSAYRAALQDGYNALFSYATAVNVTWVVVSRKANGVDRPSAVITPITNAIVIDDVVDSQRKRLPKRGS